MREALLQKVNFNLVRYANCWEDADVLIEGLAPDANSKILSIGSAGDNSFSLLVTNPELVVAVDVNKIQLYLIELKKICINKFEYNDTLEFLGFKPSSKRIDLFNVIKNELSNDARNYWQTNINQINNGIIYEGKFEKYFKLFSKKILPWIHSKKIIKELFDEKNEEAQRDFYNNKWNSFRWKLLFKIFFSRYIMGKFGRDPAFLNEVTISVSENIYNKAAQQLSSTKAQNNFILYFSLNGNYGNFLPNYMQEKNFNIIQSNIERIELHEGFAQDAFKQYHQFDCMNLSNIFEYMNNETFKSTSEMLLNSMKSGGRIAYWNLMVERKVAEILPEKVQNDEWLSNRLTKIDKGFFYNRFLVDTIK